MVADLAALVGVETPSEDLDACAAGAEAVAALAYEVFGEAGEVVEVEGRRHLRWRWPQAPGRPRIALVGHYDTVWPLGTLARWPFTVDEATGRASGPGCFDMKAGIVQLFHAVAALDDRGGLEILLTCDEEVGSRTSRALVEEAARGARAALVLEASADGAVKVGRKGTGMYRLDVDGRAAHAGLEPERGANALTALARVLTALEAVAAPERGTTVTATLAGAGTASNVVPAHAWAELDVRVAEPREATRVDRELRALTTGVEGTRLRISGGPRRPPMPAGAGAALHARLAVLAAELGLGPIAGVSVGGGSDGNFTAAVGCPTLDGLGAVGNGAHAEGEWVSVAAMPERAALLAQLVDDLRG